MSPGDINLGGDDSPELSEAGKFYAEQHARNEGLKQLWGDPEIVHRENVRLVDSAAVDALLTTSAREAEVATVKGILARHATNSVAGRELAEVFAATLGKDISEEKRLEWKEMAFSELRREFGAEKAGDALAAAKALVQSDPALAARLRNGAGSHPRLVVALAKKAMGRT